MRGAFRRRSSEPNLYDLSASMLAPTEPSTSPLPRILFVDDEPLLTRLGDEFLRRIGYDPVTATCPVDALAKFQASHFDAVITDLTMPRMSGIELARALQEIRPNVPIVLTTAFHQKLEGKSAIEMGFTGLLLKPYSIRALTDALAAALGQKPAYAANAAV
jgi:CheY-like chemotaxis protein